MKSHYLRCRVVKFVIYASSLGIAANFAAGAVIASADFFAEIPHTLLTFETDGSGNPVIVPEGGAKPLPANEYAAQGIFFNRDIWWGNEAAPEAENAQAIGGSLQISLQAPPPEDYTLTFTQPVLAFGFWMIHHTGVVLNPTITAFDNNNQEIETLTFGPDFYQGVEGVAAYGFLGLVSDRNIASVLIERNASDVDNLYFSPVPEPSTLSLLCLVGTVIAVRAWFHYRRPEGHRWWFATLLK